MKKGGKSLSSNKKSIYIFKENTYETYKQQKDKNNVEIEVEVDGNTALNNITDYKLSSKRIKITKNDVDNIKLISYSDYKLNLLLNRISYNTNVDYIINKNADFLKLLYYKINKISKKPLSTIKEEKVKLSTIKEESSSKSKKGGDIVNLKPNAKKFLSILHILDRKHDFLKTTKDPISIYILNNSINEINSIIDNDTDRNNFGKLFNEPSNNYEENILLNTINNIFNNNYFDDSHKGYNLFAFIDFGSTINKIVLYNNTNKKQDYESDANIELVYAKIIEMIKTFYNLDNTKTYKYMYDTGLHFFNHGKLHNIKDKVYDVIAYQEYPLEYVFDPHSSSSINIENDKFSMYNEITDKVFNKKSNSSLNNYETAFRDLTKTYLNINYFKIIINDTNNKYLPLITFNKDISSNAYFIKNIFNKIVNSNNIHKETDNIYYIKKIVNGKTILSIAFDYKNSFTISLISTYITLLLTIIGNLTDINNKFKRLIIDKSVDIKKVNEYILKFIIIYLYTANDNTSDYDKIKDIINILFDLKKAGDWGQSIYCSIANNINLANNKESIFISGDKLSATRSILNLNVKTIFSTEYEIVTNIKTNNAKNGMISLFKNKGELTYSNFISFLKTTFTDKEDYIKYNKILCFKSEFIEEKLFCKNKSPLNNYNTLIVDDNNIDYYILNEFIDNIKYVMLCYIKKKNIIKFASDKYNEPRNIEEPLFYLNIIDTFELLLDNDINFIKNLFINLQIVIEYIIILLKTEENYILVNKYNTIVEQIDVLITNSKTSNAELVSYYNYLFNEIKNDKILNVEFFIKHLLNSEKDNFYDIHYLYNIDTNLVIDKISFDNYFNKLNHINDVNNIYKLLLCKTPDSNDTVIKNIINFNILKMKNFLTNFSNIVSCMTNTKLEALVFLNKQKEILILKLQEHNELLDKINNLISTIKDKNDSLIDFRTFNIFYINFNKITFDTKIAEIDSRINKHIKYLERDLINNQKEINKILKYKKDKKEKYYNYYINLIYNDSLSVIHDNYINDINILKSDAKLIKLWNNETYNFSLNINELKKLISNYIDKKNKEIQIITDNIEKNYTSFNIGNPYYYQDKHDLLKKYTEPTRTSGRKTITDPVDYFNPESKENIQKLYDAIAELDNKNIDLFIDKINKIIKDKNHFLFTKYKKTVDIKNQDNVLYYISFVMLIIKNLMFNDFSVNVFNNIKEIFNFDLELTKHLQERKIEYYNIDHDKNIMNIILIFLQKNIKLIISKLDESSSEFRKIFNKENLSVFDDYLNQISLLIKFADFTSSKTLPTNIKQFSRKRPIK